jgi:phospholipase C
MVAASTAPPSRAATATPIKHLVVIFQENVSFDHYFGTYPVAKNPPGEPAFTPAPNTPSVNGLTGGLLSANPNSHNPFRLDRSQASTCDQDHDYTPEQQAFESGLMDKFPEFAGGGALAVQIMASARIWLWATSTETRLPRFGIMRSISR